MGTILSSQISVLNQLNNELIDNPYYGVELNEITPNIRPRAHWEAKYDRLKDMKEITLQTYYEILDNVEEGTYASNKGMPVMMGASVDDIKGAKANFLETFKVYLSEGVNTFSNSTQRGRLGIQAIERHPKVAGSRDTIDYNKHEFYIGEKNEAAAVSNRKRSVVKKAIMALGSLQNDYDFFDNYQFASILGVIGSDTSETLVTNKLDDFIMVEKKNRYGTQEERCDQFLSLFKDFKNSKDRVYIRYLLKQAVFNGIMNVQGGIYYWRSKKGIDHLYNLGTDIDRIENTFLNEHEKFDEDLPEANLFADLRDELISRKVLVK